MCFVWFLFDCYLGEWYFDLNVRKSNLLRSKFYWPPEMKFLCKVLTEVWECMHAQRGRLHSFLCVSVCESFHDWRYPRISVHLENFEGTTPTSRNHIYMSDLNYCIKDFRLLLSLRGCQEILMLLKSLCLVVVQAFWVSLKICKFRDENYTGWIFLWDHHGGACGMAIFFRTIAGIISSFGDFERFL